jgi:hypothetical protein
MKIYVLFLSTLFLPSLYTFGQSDIRRKGFYLSTSLGAPLGSIHGKDNSGTVLNITGTGGSFDLQIGGSIQSNLFLHATIISKVISGPEINGIKVPDRYSVNETVIGAGLTKYLAQNFFLTGNIGSGKFTLEDGNQTSSTDNGFSFQIKAGKEWWIAKKWLLGISAQYSQTSLTSNPGGGIEEKWSSGRFGLMLNVSHISHRSDRR